MDYSILLTPVVTVITAYITVLDLAQLRFSLKKKIVIISLVSLFQIILNALILFLFGIEMYAKAFLLTIDIPAFTLFYYFSKRRDFRDLFTVTITIFISFVISIPALCIRELFNDIYWYYNISRLLIFAVLFIPMHFLIRKRYKMLQDNIDRGWGFYSLLPIIGIAVLYYQLLKYTINHCFSDIILVCIFIIVMLAIVFFVFYYVFIQLQDKYLVLEQKRILSMQNKAQRTQYEQQKEAVEKANRRWHDLRHMIQELIELLETGDTATAIGYLKEQRGIEYVPMKRYCLHPAVNSILCLWAERSRSADINVTINTDIPEQINMEPMELASLFANAFENAFEGCMRLAGNSYKFIKVESRYSDNTLAIGVTNSCIDDIKFVNDMPVSSKKDGGIGTRSMVYTVQRFSGTKYFEAKEGVFIARFILNIN